jgi:hypothetical protein
VNGIDPTGTQNITLVGVMVGASIISCLWGNYGLTLAKNVQKSKSRVYFASFALGIGMTMAYTLKTWKKALVGGIMAALISVAILAASQWIDPNAGLSQGHDERMFTAWVTFSWGIPTGAAEFPEGWKNTEPIVSIINTVTSAFANAEENNTSFKTEYYQAAFVAIMQAIVADWLKNKLNGGVSQVANFANRYLRRLPITITRPIYQKIPLVGKNISQVITNPKVGKAIASTMSDLMIGFIKEISKRFYGQKQ